MNKKMNNKGFSLVELIVVIAVMGILAVTLAPRLSQYIEKARVTSDQEAVNSIFTAAKLANAEYPLGDEATLILDGTIFTVPDTGDRDTWTITPYTDAGIQGFVDAMSDSLSSFKLKSSDVSETTSIRITTDANGLLSISLYYVIPETGDPIANYTVNE